MWTGRWSISRGLDGPFVHDLCAYGYACRLAIAGLFPGSRAAAPDVRL